MALETEFIPSLQRTLEETRLFLEDKHTKAEKEEKINLLEQQKSQLYGLLSTLDFLYHQGEISYDEHRDRMVALLQNQPLQHYIVKIDHLIQACKKAET